MRIKRQLSEKCPGPMRFANIRILIMRWSDWAFLPYIGAMKGALINDEVTRNDQSENDFESE
jgi:hypothetical protein